MNIRKLSKTSKVAQAAVFSLGLAAVFCACTGTNVVGTDEQENTIADGNNPAINAGNPDIDHPGDISGHPGDDIIDVPPLPGSSSSSSSISITTPSSSSNVEVSSSSSIPDVGGNDLEKLLEAAAISRTLSNGIDGPEDPGPIIGSEPMTATAKNGELFFKSSAEKVYISCDANDSSTHSYSILKFGPYAEKEFISSTVVDHTVFKENCEAENGTYTFKEEGSSSCRISAADSYEDPNWSSFSSKVIKHCEP